MSRHYDRQGNPISMEEWSTLLNDPKYQIVAQTTGSGRFVSTVWLGLDHAHGGGPPLIFETIVFAIDEHGDVDYHELDAERYSTEEAAKKGHEQMAQGHAYVLDKIVREIEKSEVKLDLWTIQTEEAYEKLKTDGRLVGDWRRVWKHFKEPYKWLCDQMENRGIRLNGRPPIWAWAVKPDLRRSAHLDTGKKGVRLKIQVPYTHALISNFSAWHCVLNNHYVYASDADFDKEFTRDQIELSWQRIFDLDWCSMRADYHERSQVTLPVLELSQVKQARAFTAR
jgi:hypothetical protein